MGEETKKNHHDNSSIDTELQQNLINFWEKYQSHLIMAVILVCIGIVGFEGVKFYNNHQIRRLQDSYMAAELDGKKMQFAEEHAMEPISGVVWLKAGDEFYAKKDYAESMEYYQKSVKALRKTLLKGRGGMGVAMTKIMIGNENEGKEILSELVHDEQAMGVIRCQAAYQLALLSLQAKDYKETKDFLDIIKHIPDSGIWEQKALVVAESTPELVKFQAN